VSLNEPINAIIDTKIFPKASDVAKTASLNMPGNFPTVKDAVKDYQISLYCII
jgi:hypothetical protein